MPSSLMAADKPYLLLQPSLGRRTAEFFFRTFSFSCVHCMCTADLVYRNIRTTQCSVKSRRLSNKDSCIYCGYKIQQPKFFYFFSTENLIANISFYALSWPKLNFRCYLTFEIIFKALFQWKNE